MRRLGILLALSVVVAVVAIFFTLFSYLSGPREIPITEVIGMARGGQIEAIEVRSDQLTIFTTRDETLSARKGESLSVLEIFQNAGIEPLAADFDIIPTDSSWLRETVIEPISTGLSPLMLLYFVFLGIGVLGTAFWIWMLVECATNEPDEGNSRVVWIIIIVVTHLIGAGSTSS